MLSAFVAVTVLSTTSADDTAIRKDTKLPSDA